MGSAHKLREVMSRAQNWVSSFVSHATSHPDDPALVWCGEETTYRELHALANRERARITRLAPERDKPIGVLAKKSPPAIALVLACLMEGRSFLLPSPTLPPATVKGLFERAGCRYVLSPQGPPESWPESLFSLRPSGSTEPRPAGPGRDVSFMFTTSGSTGQPKVVPLRTGAVDRFTDWAGERFRIERGTTVLSYAPLNFDLSLLDIWTTLKRGGRVVLVDPTQVTRARSLLDVVERYGVQVVQAVPMFFGLLADAATACGRRIDTVDHVILTGDHTPPRLLAELPRLFGDARLYNVYGCTETNDSFLYEIDGTEPSGRLPIGSPLPGVHAVIVGADGQTLTGPGSGELYVTTPFQTDGYLDPEQNADRFTIRHQGQERLRYFRSGDLVHRDENGRIVLEGRSDHQVKVRGVRVNTREVEHVLEEHPDVVEAAVVAVPDAVAGHLLRCQVRRRPSSGLNSLELRGHCAHRLSPTAIPSALRIVDDPLPRTSTGKIDRALIAAHPHPSQPSEGQQR
ncbi:AMP-binding protein [Streptomyces sp. NPDC047315]|uniref:AMP-binding protein n=1 Tax=Streptomyces sp. NPDC047315 TaxID=3155142 RepID=UPI0033C22EF8